MIVPPDMALSAPSGHTLRILLVIYAYPPVMGGSEIEAQRVASALMRRGHKVQVLCTGGPEMPPVRDWVDPTGVSVRILTNRSAGRIRDRIFALRVALEIWRTRHDYDVVYFLMQGLHLASGLPVARFAAKPAVVKISGSGIIPVMRQTSMGRRELNWLQRWKIPLMVLNEGMMDEARQAGFAREQLIWMPNPVDIDEFRPALRGEAAAWRERHGIGAAAKVGIYVGRISLEKGLPALIRGFAHAARSMPDAMLLLVGDGPMRGELEEMVRNLGADGERIRFVGRVTPGDVSGWLRASDVYALTSPNEGFACALLEAMATGLPSIVSDIPANLQLVDDGVHGITVPFDSETAIASAFENLLADPETRRRMGAAARERVVENYSTDKVAARYERMFESVLQMKAHP